VVVSADGDLPGGGSRPGEPVRAVGPPTEDAVTTVAVFEVPAGGVVVQVPVVIWSTKRRLVQVVGVTPGGKPETRDVEVSGYLGMGLELVGAGVPVTAWADTAATPGWRVDLDETAETYTVLCPDGGVGITGSYRPRDPGEAGVISLWVGAVRARAAVLLLTGVIVFDGREPDLVDAQHQGGLLRGVAAYTPPGRSDDVHGKPVRRRWNLFTRRRGSSA